VSGYKPSEVIGFFWRRFDLLAICGLLCNRSWFSPYLVMLVY
jgi:hypothetical protein